MKEGKREEGKKGREGGGVGMHPQHSATNRPAKWNVFPENTNWNTIMSRNPSKHFQGQQSLHLVLPGVRQACGMDHFRGMTGSPTNCQNHFLLWLGVLLPKHLITVNAPQSISTTRNTWKNKQGSHSPEPSKVLLTAPQFPPNLIRLLPLYISAGGWVKWCTPRGRVQRST